MGTDFVDDDLIRQRQAALKIKLDGEGSKAPRDGHIPSSREFPTRPVSDISLTPLARHKQEVTEQMVDKVQELDRLRARQEELERERRMLEELRQKHEAFDTGRRELKDRLNESLMRMAKEQMEAERLAQLLDETRRLFRARLEEVEALNEESWPDEQHLDELNKALVLLENIRADYNKSLGRIEAIRPAVGSHEPVQTLMAGGPGGTAAGGWRYWLRAGLAFSLPLMIWMTLALLIWLLWDYWG